MVHRTSLLTLLFGAAALVACSQDRAGAPIAPTAISRASVPSAPACNLSGARVHAASYFVARDPVFDRISAMQRAYATGGAAGATNAGFDVLARVSTALKSSGAIVGTSAAGNVFVNDILACMNVGTLPSGFSVQEALGPNGLFAVVGGPNDPPAGVTSRGVPTYGAEPQMDQTWFASAGNRRFLLYGFPRDYSFSVETPAATTAYELSTVPTPLTFSPAIAVGVCQTTSSFAQLQHVGIILAPRGLVFCSGTSAAPSSGNGVFALAQRAWASLAPTPLFAAALGGTGSLVSGLSPIGAITYVPSAGDLEFVQQPTDLDPSHPRFSPPIAVSAGTANDTPVNGVLITLTVRDAGGNIVPVRNNTAYTNGNAIAVFTGFNIERAGTYTITATGTILGQQMPSVQSNSFVVVR